MSATWKLRLIALWLIVSCPFNVALLKHLIRDTLALALALDAGLGDYLAAQYLLALAFALLTAILLLRRSRLGHLLAVALLAGSCAELVLLFLEKVFLALTGHPAWFTGEGWAINAVLVTYNVLGLRVLFELKRAEPR